jgi:hypothetical protein
MGAYTGVHFKNRRNANQFNQHLGIEVVKTIDLMYKDYIETTEEEKNDFPNKWGMPFTFKNYVKAYEGFYELNSFSLKVSSYDDEDLNLWEKIYNLVIAFKNEVVETSNWDRFCKELGKDINEADSYLIAKESNFEPEKLPLKDQILYNSPEYRKGISICPPLKTWGIGKVNVLFGHVNKPHFLKTKEYVNDLYNSLVRDETGNAYILIPTLTLSPTMRLEFDQIYQQLFDLSIREEYFMLGNLLFPMLVKELGSKDQTVIIDHWKQYYSKEELEQRLNYAKTKQTVYKQVGTENTIADQFVKMLEQCI